MKHKTAFQKRLPVISKYLVGKSTVVERGFSFLFKKEKQFPVIIAPVVVSDVHQLFNVTVFSDDMFCEI